MTTSCCGRRAGRRRARARAPPGHCRRVRRGRVSAELGPAGGTVGWRAGERERGPGLGGPGLRGTRIEGAGAQHGAGRTRAPAPVGQLAQSKWRGPERTARRRAQREVNRVFDGSFVSSAQWRRREAR